MSNDTPHKSPELKIDIINAFGADTSPNLLDPICYLTSKNIVIYPVGHHIQIRDLSSTDETKINNVQFIYLESDSEKITAMNVSPEKNVLVLCENSTRGYCTISVYYLAKIFFDTVTIYKPKRKIFTNKFYNFTSCSFTQEGNLICAVCKETETHKAKCVVYNVQKFQPAKLNLATPTVVFDVDERVRKISIYKRILCATGKDTLSFWYLYENAVKEIKSTMSQAKHYIDHRWIEGKKLPQIIIITNDNELFVLEGSLERENKLYNKNTVIDETNVLTKINKFIIKQHLLNIFNSTDVNSTVVNVFTNGAVVGNNKGDLLIYEAVVKSHKGATTFIQHEQPSKHKVNKINNNSNNNQSQSFSSGIERTFIPVRLIERKFQSEVTGISFNTTDSQMVVSFKSNEIAYANIENLFEKLDNKLYEIPFNIVCNGFHSGEITAMEISAQRPIIITASQQDKTIRVWNYITGHSEYCKLVLTETNDYKANNLDILCLALHPNGYYVCISDGEMLWFFHLCYKELRFYGTDRPGPSEQKKAGCRLLKFSNGGHILAAISGRHVHLIQTITRETIKSISTDHNQDISDVIFSDNDMYVYTIGNEGFIYQINLFTFSVEKLISKYIHYTSGSYFLSTNYDDGRTNTSSLIACGLGSTDTSNLAQLDFIPAFLPTEESTIKQSEIITLDKNVIALCSIKSKKYDIIGIAGGTDKGSIILYPYPALTHKHWDEVFSHFGKVNKLIYNKETNLLFSCGADGNVFVYGVYEYNDGDNVFFDNRITNVNQLNTVLDEGLGENVLYPIYALSKFDELEKEKHELHVAHKDKIEMLERQNKQMLKDLENEILSKKQQEIQALKEQMLTLEIQNKETIEQYEQRLQKQIEDYRKKLNEQNNLAQDRIKSLEDELYSQQVELARTKKANALDLKQKTREYQFRFNQLQKEITDQVKQLEKEKDTISKTLHDLQIEKEQNLKSADREYELERNVLLHKQEQKNDEYEFEIENKHYEIIRLKDQKKKLEETLSNKDRDNRTLCEKIDALQNLITVLKQSNEQKDMEKENLVKRLTEIEKYVQEKEKMGAFTNKLKNELFRRNVRLNVQCNNYERENREFEHHNKKMAKAISNTVIEVKKMANEKKNLNIKVDGLKGETENLRHKLNLLQANFDEVLLKIYESFQSGNKNEIFRCVCEIYRIYLSDEFLDKMNKKKLIVDIREELEKQIDSLQNSIHQEQKNKMKLDDYNNKYKENKINENSNLLNNCARLKIKNFDLGREVSNLKGMNRALNKKIYNLKQELNFPKLHKSNSVSNFNEMEVVNLIKTNYLNMNSANGNQESSNMLNAEEYTQEQHGHNSNNNVTQSVKDTKTLTSFLPAGSLMTIKHLGPVPNKKI